MEEYRKYFSPAQLQALLATTPSWGVDIVNIGHNIHHGPQPYPDPNHPSQYHFDWEHGRVLDEFQLVYIANGQGVFESDGVPQVPVEGGTAFLLFPHVWHRYKPRAESGWEEFWVGFKGHYAEYLMRQDCFDPLRPLMHIGFHTELLHVFTQLVQTLRDEKTAYQQIATCQVIQLLGLIYASALMKNAVPSRQEQVSYQARYEIQKSWADTIDFEAMAQGYGVSYVWFRKAFKAVMGVPPGQYHLNLKLEKASHQLRETTLAISEISYACGFESTGYFSRIFKSKLHTTPREHREQAARRAI